MPWCGPTCIKWTVFGFGVFFVIVGFVLIFATGPIVDLVKDNELNLGSDGTIEYGMWEETPIPMYIDFYLFNWTNWQKVVDLKWTIKPKFVEMGPYSFHEKHYRKNVVFNDNHTLTYQTQRVWHFAPEKTKGSLDDLITTVNPVLVTIINYAKFKHPIVKMAVNFLLEEKNATLTVTKTAREFIFDGYDDPLLDLLHKLHLRHVEIPFKNFGWFAERNGSITYDGTYNMYDGTDDIRKLGRFTAWNYSPTTPYYPSYCGYVNGTSGEMWYPVQDDSYVEVFSPDICSSLRLKRSGTLELHGIEGHAFVADDRPFDNGTLYPEMKCFSPEEVLPSGVRNISQCKFGAPALVSYPHFYLADPFYRTAIDGMHPDASKHQISIAIEPETGLPLQATVAAQVNLRLEPLDRIKMLKDVKTHYIPVLWFKQYATLSSELAYEGKLLLTLPEIGRDTGYGVLALGCLLFIIFGFVTWKKLWGGRPRESLLNHEAF